MTRKLKQKNAIKRKGETLFEKSPEDHLLLEALAIVLEVDHVEPLEH